MRPAVVFLALSMVLALAPAAAGDLVDGADALEGECSPPCGEINPRITFSFPELDGEPIELQEGESRTFEGEVVYWTDTDDEGHAPHDPTQDIVIQFSFPSLPVWATMSIEPNQVGVPISSCAECFQIDADGSRPSANYQFNQSLELTVTAEDTPQATTGYDYGKLQLFAKSTESGIYNPGYGIREVRVQPGEDLEAQSTEETSNVPGASVLAALSTLAAAALVARRRS